ncbi:agmatine deiminase family protein [Weissella coleopterorum]|uniref:Agmatine deiminase family protein n=1 Tax=Weissella coleopterorum TaxID=2714949 RepID=A0A6G8AYC5_9LACO|nr:agmatine deiminase family protein [Weissella coleopterorum]QIL50007.1 agmatine deiminase family protein [Weissella coleopterorum]
MAQKLSILIIFALFITMGISTTRGSVMASESEGTIYTGTPDIFDSYYMKQKHNLKIFSNDLKVEPNNQLHYGDIWVRDIAPVITNRIVKFKYAPSYLDSSFELSINKRFNKWLRNQNLDIIKSDIILDGGNFVYNNKETVIITKRILSDNYQYDQKTLIRKLKKILNVKNIILINEEPGDILGHADGMVNFINSNTLLISSFEGVDTVKQQIRNILPNGSYVNNSDIKIRINFEKRFNYLTYW